MLRNPESDSLLLIPFYTDPAAPIYDQAVKKFQDFAGNAKEATGLTLAVVDDGAKLKPEDFKTVDHLITIPENQGKAFAVRTGLKTLLQDPNIHPGFIIQYDGDGDQSYADIPRVLERLYHISETNPNKRALVIGDRYSEELSIPPNPESVDYRQSILMFFGALSGQFGFEGVRDWVSGARGYTRSYAHEFLNRSRSSRYGIESEQLVIAFLSNSKVTTAPLTESRPRDPWTLTSKWLQNFEVYLDHLQELRDKGQGNLVDLVLELIKGLKSDQDKFDLELSPIGESTTMHFRRWDEIAHTALIPAEYRSKLFAESKFPFTIRRS